MTTKREFYPKLVTIGLFVGAVSLIRMSAQQPGDAVRIDNDDIGGVVTSAKGPEAGVWVIAETTDLPTKFSKIVVTDDRGTLRHTGPSESELQRLGPRLWAWSIRPRFGWSPARSRT